MCVIEITIVCKCFRLRFTLYKFLVLFNDSHELCVHVAIILTCYIHLIAVFVPLFTNDSIQNYSR